MTKLLRTKLLKTSLFITMLTIGAAAPVYAQDYKPDDSVAFDLSAEGWVMTKTARVMVAVEAAVTGNTAGGMRASMTKAVGDIVKTDWRLTSFNRGQDQTGLERWSAQYEARVPENELGGLNDKAKQISKPGMQVRITNIDFSPTLEETQATAAQLRTQILKQANEQLATINSTLSGRTYRIGTVEFNAMGGAPMPMMAKMRTTMTAMSNGGAMAEMDSAGPMERSEKMLVSARVVMASTPTTVSTK